MRTLFDIFAQMVVATGEADGPGGAGGGVNGNALQDELEILIRKHVSQSALRFRRIGIIGRVAQVRRLLINSLTHPAGITLTQGRNPLLKVAFNRQG